MAATSRTESYDALLTTTARHLQPDIRDNITRSNKKIAYLMMKGRFRQLSGGERIQVPLMYELNTGADIYDGYGQLDTTPQDGITSAFFPWAQLAVPISISGKERRQNSGREQIMNLLQAKIRQAENSGQELLNNCCVAGRLPATGAINQFFARQGKLDPSANGPLPLPVLVDADPNRSVAIGDINPANESWWENQILDSSATTYAAYKRDKLRLYMQCTRGVGGPPDLIISDERTWQVYWGSLEDKERYFVTDQRVINTLGGANDEQLKYRNAVHIWDEVVPDVGDDTANVVDSVGSYLADGSNGTEYHLNTDYMEYVYHSDANWDMTPFITPVNQDATVAHILWMGQVVISNRRKLGVMFNVLNTIAA